jgi:hypothetical protein
MSPGYLAMIGRANWVDSIGYFDASVFKGETVIGNLDVILSTAHLRGWRCTGCGLMTIDYRAGSVSA